MNKIKIGLLAVAIVAASGLMAVAPAFAQTGVNVGESDVVSVQSGGIHDGANGGAWHAPGGIFGTVSAVSGNTLSVVAGVRSARPMPEQSGDSAPMKGVTVATTTYAVDATNAKIYKGSATTTVALSAITVGDTVVVQGAVSGTNITATVIHDGLVPMPMMPGRPGMPGKFFGKGATSTPSGTPPFVGDGEPVVGGAVTNVTGTTITLTNASNVTYTVSAASSTIMKNGTSSGIGAIAVGDNLIVQGAVNGNAITASAIIDQGAKKAPGDGSSTAPHGPGVGIGGGFKGFFGAIGGFFQHLFGF